MQSKVTWAHYLMVLSISRWCRGAIKSDYGSTRLDPVCFDVDGSGWSVQVCCAGEPFCTDSISLSSQSSVLWRPVVLPA